MELTLKIGFEEALDVLRQLSWRTSSERDAALLGDYSLRVSGDGRFRLAGKGTRSQRAFPFDGQIARMGHESRLRGHTRPSAVTVALIIVVLGAAVLDVTSFGWAFGLGGAMCFLAFWLLVFLVLGLSWRRHRHGAEDQYRAFLARVFSAHMHTEPP